MNWGRQIMTRKLLLPVASFAEPVRAIPEEPAASTDAAKWAWIIGERKIRPE